MEVQCFLLVIGGYRQIQLHIDLKHLSRVPRVLQWYTAKVSGIWWQTRMKEPLISGGDWQRLVGLMVYIAKQHLPVSTNGRR
jgi:hypothetical protein